MMFITEAAIITGDLKYFDGSLSYTKSTQAILKNWDSENNPYKIAFLFDGTDASAIISINIPGNA